MAGFRALGEGGRWKMYSKEIQRKSAGKAEYLPQPKFLMVPGSVWYCKKN